MGDLTFLHDVTGLVIGPHEPRPDLTIVVSNNDGGAIFSTLEPGEPQHARAFDRVFGTPHGVMLAGLAESCGAEHVFVSTADELADAIGDPGGIRVVEVPTSRTELLGTLRRLTEAVTRSAVTGGPVRLGPTAAAPPRTGPTSLGTARRSTRHARPEPGSAAAGMTNQSSSPTSSSGLPEETPPLDAINLVAARASLRARLPSPWSTSSILGSDSAAASNAAARAALCALAAARKSTIPATMAVGSVSSSRCCTTSRSSSERCPSSPMNCCS